MVGYEIAAVDVVDVDTVHVVGFAGIVDVVVVFGVLMLFVDVAIADIAVVVAVVGVEDGIGVEDVAVDSVVASVAPYQRPSKRTHREPSNRFDLPEIFFYNSII